MASYILRVRARFEAAHHLTSYRGEPEPVHGHSWTVEAAFLARELDAEGMGLDFVLLKNALEELAARFHSRHINTVPPFDRQSPTTEHLAAWFHQELVSRFPGETVLEVTVWEGSDCAATYRP